MSLFFYTPQHYKRKHLNINQEILKSALVFQYLALKHLNALITIDDILSENHGETGLIGHGNSCITHCLERLCGGSEIFHLHSALHDAQGRFYKKYRKGRGYCYA